MAYSIYPPPYSNAKQVAPTRRYQIRQKLFSLLDSFKIKDEMDQPVFSVRSKLAWGDKLILEDMSGK